MSLKKHFFIIGGSVVAGSLATRAVSVFTDDIEALGAVFVLTTFFFLWMGYVLDLLEEIHRKLRGRE